MMDESVNIRVNRAFDNEDDFLEAEAWSITARSMLLIDVDPLPEGTAIRCELRLTNGRPLVIAEGFAVKHLGATATRPAGLVVRYKRMSAASSEFVARAVARSAENRIASSPSAAARPPLPPPPSSQGGRGRLDSASPQRRLSSGPPPRPSRLPPGLQPPNQSSRPPKNSNRPAAPPPSASSVSVVPPARRSSTLPPVTPKGTGRSPSAAPSIAAGAAPALTDRPSLADARTSNRPSPAIDLPQTRRSGVPKSAPLPEDRAQSAQHRDSAAMERLRKRAAAKAISTPPDREAILSRLKRTPHR